jgi:hypothetical protein
VWPFESKQTIEPAPIAAPVDRAVEARANYLAVKAEGRALDRAFLEFRQKYKATVDRFGRLVYCEVATLSGKAAVQREWDCLLRAAQRWTVAWAAAQRDLNEAEKQRDEALKMQEVTA